MHLSSFALNLHNSLSEAFLEDKEGSIAMKSFLQMEKEAKLVSIDEEFVLVEEKISGSSEAKLSCFTMPASIKLFSSRVTRY